jgi:integrase
MTVRIRPVPAKRNGKPGMFEYSIRFHWPEGGVFRERKNAPVSGKSNAQRYAEQRERAIIAAGKGGLEAQAPAPLVDTLEEFWPRLVRDHYQANRKKPSTIDAAQTIFRVHLKGLLGKKRLSEISNADVAALKGALSDKTPKSAYNILSVLSKALHCAVDWGVIAFVPCKIGLFKVPRGQAKWYERHDYRRLVDASEKIGSSSRVLVLLGGSAGLRRGEIIALKWTDLDLPRRLIHVQRAIWRGHEESPKGGRGRIVPMTPELCAALKAHKHLIGERVLYSNRGRMLSNRVIRNWFGSVQRRAGLEVNGAIHQLRHTFCSHLAAAGAPAKSIQELAGHTDIATMQRYMHLSPSDRGGAINTLAAYYAAPEQDNSWSNHGAAPSRGVGFG